MDMSTIEAGLMKIKEAEVNINFLMEDKHQQFISRTHAQGLRLILQKGLEDKYAQVIVDPIRLGQVLDFLMDNATKFTETGHIIFGYGIGDESLKFFVQDSGIGIDRSHMNNIFNRFRQGHDPKNSQYGGTGLGLSISKAIIENMSGDIYFSSTVGKGSTFYFSIPYKKAKPSSLLRNRSASSKPKAVSK